MLGTLSRMQRPEEHSNPLQHDESLKQISPFSEHHRDRGCTSIKSKILAVLTFLTTG